MNKKIFFIIIFFNLISCKSREDIAREQMIDTLSIQMKDVQKLNTGTFSKLQQFEERLKGLTGQVEETDHNTKVSINSKIQDLEARLTYLEGQNSKNIALLATINNSQKTNQKYITDVLSSLKKISKTTKNKSPYQMAMLYYKQRKYSKAIPLLLNLSNLKKIRGNKKARVLHNLGMIAYNQKRYDNALIYYSQLITTYSKSWYARNGYLFLARTFHRQNKKMEAMTSYRELIKKYPKSNQAKIGNKYLLELEARK